MAKQHFFDRRPAQFRRAACTVVIKRYIQALGMCRSQDARHLMALLKSLDRLDHLERSD